MVRTPQGADGNPRWRAMSGVIAVYTSFGFAIGAMGPLVPSISDELGLSRSAMGSILGAWALIYVFTAVPAGAFVDRIGVRSSITIGAASIAISLALRAVAGGGPSLFLAVAVFGIGGPLVSISTPKLVAALFEEDQRRLPTGLAVAAPGLGSALGYALPNSVLLPAFGGSWRAVLGVGAMAAVLAGAYWLWAARRLPSPGPHAPAVALGTLSRLLKVPVMRSVLWIATFSFALSHALNGWLPEVLSDAGLADVAAGNVAALSTVVGIVGSLTIARGVPPERRAQALVSIYCVLAVTTVALGQSGAWGASTAALVLGYARAGSMPLLFLTMMDDESISVAEMGAATGLFFAFAEVGGFGGPWAVGAIADRSGGFAAAMVALAAIALAAAAGALRLQRLARRPAEIQPMAS